ncbi:MAG: hypothetical protein HYT37_00995 [Candidatus Sungbacteria bacterium]|nr:hypothetical protein [Candidatus Sungbacteria bacterium]
MGARWTKEEEQKYREELLHLYVEENKPIKEIGSILGIAEQTVFQRMQRLEIASTPERKLNYVARRRSDVAIPNKRTPGLAEFFGIMLGDGRLAPYQIVVTLGTKEIEYVEHVASLMYNLFAIKPKIGVRKNGFRDIYLGSLDLVEWFLQEGLVHNKVQAQVDMPAWLFEKDEYMERFLRGFFDTDGSIYKLRFGTQLSFTNKSQPLLQSIRKVLFILQYHPSSINSNIRFYLTRKEEILRFFKEIKPANSKHQRRFQEFFSGQVVP